MSGPNHTPTRRPARWPLAALLCVGLGLLMNAGAVVVCSYDRAVGHAADIVRFVASSSYPNSSFREAWAGSATAWPVPVPSDWPSTPDTQRIAERAGWTERSFFRMERQAAARLRRWTLDHVEVGWPFRSAADWTLSEVDTGAVLRETVFTSRGHSPRLTILSAPAAPLGMGWDRVDVIIPLRPLWPGLIANTFVYAAFAYVALLAARTLRGLRRTLRGLCPVCAYSRAGLATAAPCPECGAASRAGIGLG